MSLLYHGLRNPVNRQNDQFLTSFCQNGCFEASDLTATVSLTDSPTVSTGAKTELLWTQKSATYVVAYTSSAIR